MARERTMPSKTMNERTGSVRKTARHLEGVKEIDPNDYELLRRFLTDQGKVMPSRLTGANAKQQRQIKRAVRRARVMGLLP
jgi:small subunit ribosomal protein S18